MNIYKEVSVPTVIECWKVHEKPEAIIVKEKKVVKEEIPVLIEDKDYVPVCEHFQKGRCA